MPMSDGVYARELWSVRGGPNQVLPVRAAWYLHIACDAELLVEDTYMIHTEATAPLL